VLSEIVAFLPKFDTSFILQYWQNCINCTGMAQPSLLHLLCIMLWLVCHGWCVLPDICYL